MDKTVSPRDGSSLKKRKQAVSSSREMNSRRKASEIYGGLDLSNVPKNLPLLPPCGKSESPYRGIKKYREQWMAGTYVCGEYKHLGIFDSPEEAALVYARALFHIQMSRKKQGDTAGEFRHELNASDEQWFGNFGELCTFKRETGHCNVPAAYAKNRRLANWVHTQRHQYKLMQKGEPSYMTEERMQFLDDIDFVWNFKTITTWDDRFNRLCQYREEFGDCNVPSVYSQNRQLAVWVKNQRWHYRNYQEGKPSPMTRERVQRLENIGFEWKLRQS